MSHTHPSQFQREMKVILEHEMFTRWITLLISDFNRACGAWAFTVEFTPVYTLLLCLFIAFILQTLRVRRVPPSPAAGPPCPQKPPVSNQITIILQTGQNVPVEVISGPADA